MNTILEIAERTPEGWLIADIEQVNNDPWRNDDNWHRGEFTRYTLRGTNLRVDEGLRDTLGQAYDTFLKKVVELGYDGVLVLTQKGRLPHVVDCVHYTDSWVKADWEQRKEIEDETRARNHAASLQYRSEHPELQGDRSFWLTVGK